MEGSRGKGSTTPTGQKAEVAGNTPGDVRRMLLEAGGPSTKTKSGIDLTAAAHKLGVTRRTVERWLKTAQTGSRSPMSALRGKIFSALTGQKADVSGKPTGDLRGMLLAVGGASPKTKSGIDLTAAAHKLGVTRRTVERWLKAAETGAGQRPSIQHAKNLATRARQAATTKAGRRAALDASPIAKAVLSRGARVAVSGVQGPRRAGREYMRDRTTQLELDPDQVESMLNAWEQGGEKGFMSWMGDTWGEEYVAGWKFDSVDDISIERPSGSRWH